MKNVNAIAVNWLNIMNKYADASLKEKIADCKRKGSKKDKEKAKYTFANNNSFGHAFCCVLIIVLSY